jgi:hypothetical protein
MVASGVLLDEGMIYFDARLSRRYPTVETDIVRDLVVHVRDSLERFGDMERVQVGIDRLARVGTGATVQRRTFAKPASSSTSSSRQCAGRQETNLAR